MKKVSIFSLLIALFCLVGFNAHAVVTGQIGAEWTDTDGNLVPDTASTYNIGSASYPVGTVYADSVTKTTRDIGTINFPAAAFSLSSTGAPLTASTAPGSEIDNLWQRKKDLLHRIEELT